MANKVTDLQRGMIIAIAAKVFAALTKFPGVNGAPSGSVDEWRVLELKKLGYPRLVDAPAAAYHDILRHFESVAGGRAILSEAELTEVGAAYGNSQLMLRLLESGEGIGPQTLEIPLVEAEPGKFLPESPIPREMLPRRAVVSLALMPGGTYKPVIRLLSKWVQCSYLLHEMGFHVSPVTISRLWQNGFINACKPTPQILLVDVVSLHEHLEATRDPEFWDEATRRDYDQSIITTPKARGPVDHPELFGENGGNGEMGTDQPPSSAVSPNFAGGQEASKAESAVLTR